MWGLSELRLVALFVLGLLLLLVLGLALFLAVLGVHAAAVLLVLHGIHLFSLEDAPSITKAGGDYTLEERRGAVFRKKNTQDREIVVYWKKRTAVLERGDPSHEMSLL